MLGWTDRLSAQIDMLPLLAQHRFFWRLRLSGRSLEETRHRAGWKVARIQGPVSARYQHALKTLRNLWPKRRGQAGTTCPSTQGRLQRRRRSPSERGQEA